MAVTKQYSKTGWQELYIRISYIQYVVECKNTMDTTPFSELRKWSKNCLIKLPTTIKRAKEKI